MNRNLTSQVFRRIGPNCGSVFITEHFLERVFFRFYLDYRFTAISPKIRVAIRAIPAGEHAALQLVFTVRELETDYAPPPPTVVPRTSFLLR